MSYTMNKEKNLIKFLADGKKTPYIFDVNTGIFYGLKGQPIKTYPSEFKIWVNENRNESAVLMLLNNMFHSPYRFHDDWSMITLNELTNYADLFKCMDKLDSINYDIDCICGDVSTIKFINNHFKKFTKALKENPEMTMEEFYLTYNKNMWLEKNKIKVNEHLTEELIDELYKYRNHFNINNRLSYVVLYLSRGLRDFFDDVRYEYEYNRIFDKLRRYFEYCEALGIEPTKDDFFRSFINVYRMYVIKKREIDSKKIKEQYKKYPMLEFENEIFTVVIPKTTEDFFNEAQAQQNCVYSMYLSKVIQGTTNVVFIRRKDNIEKSLITCEVSNNGNIIQYLKKYNNDNLNEDETEFKKLYKTHLSNTWKR